MANKEIFDNKVEKGQIKGNWAVSRFGIRDIWAYTRGEGVKVAVLDTGVDLKHPLLKKHFLSNNAVTEKITDQVSNRIIDLTGSMYRVIDTIGHGTHITGTIACPYHGIGIAPGCILYIAKVIGDDGVGKETTLTDGIYWALRQKVDIICISAVTKKDSLEIRYAIETAERMGCVVICAVGNQGPCKGSVGYPARYPTAIGVGGIDRNLRPLMDTSLGEGLNILAPGHDIYSTALNGGVVGMSGSSMAAAFMTGLVALLLGKWKEKISMTPDVIREQLWKMTIPLGEKGIYGQGMISVKEFIQTFNYKQTEKCLHQQN